MIAVVVVVVMVVCTASVLLGAGAVVLEVVVAVVLVVVVGLDVCARSGMSDGAGASSSELPPRLLLWSGATGVF